MEKKGYKASGGANPNIDAYFSIFLEHSDSISIKLDDDLKIVNLNPAAEKYYKVKKSSVLGKGYGFLESHNAAFFKMLDAAKNSSTNIATLLTQPNKDSECSIEWTITYMKNMEAHGYLVIGNVLAQKQYSKMQDERIESYLKEISSCMPGNFYWKDKNGCYLGCNQAVLTMMGYENEQELIGKTDLELWPEQAEELHKNDCAVMKSDKPLHLKEMVQQKGCKPIYFEAVKIPLKDANGNVIGIIGNSLDITDRNERIESYLKEISSCMPGNFYWKDKNGRYLGCNQALLTMLGYKSEQEFIGKTDYDLWPDQAEELHRNDCAVMKSDKPVYLEETVQKEGRKPMYFEVVKVPLKDASGNVIGIIGNSLDITYRKEAEELKVKQEAAEKVAKFTNLMAGSIAHEFKNPLMAIGMQMDVLEKELETNKFTPQEKDLFLRNMITHIKRVVKTTKHVVDDMLLKIRTFATGEVPKYSFEEISITADIENLLETYPFEHNDQDLVQVSYGARFKYLGDKALTSHVLGNLLKNAIFAINETDKKGKITIETKTDGDFNLLIFRDTGKGIAKDFVDKIFDQFETKKTTRGGTGLGLAFCKMVMEYYGGSITCDSEEGKYAEFVLRFPRIGKI